MENKKNRVLIIGIGPWSDKGHAAISSAMISDIRKELNDLEITLSASTFLLEDTDKFNYGKYEVNLVQGIFNRYYAISKKLNIKKIFKFPFIIVYLAIFITTNLAWLFLYKYFKINTSFLFFSNRHTIKEYINSDYVIFGGGQTLIHTVAFPFAALYELFFVTSLNKPTMIYANSIGPFNHQYSIPLIRYILNKVDVITVREKSSKKLLQDIRVTTPTFVTADAAFSLTPISSDSSKKIIEEKTGWSENCRYAGITAIQWNFPNEKNREKKKRMYNNYLIVLAKSADYLIEKYGFNIIFFPQVRSNVKDDVIALKKVFKKMKNKNNAKVITDDFTPEEIQGMYGQMQLLIGSRFHSCIFSLSLNVIPIVIEYEGHKSSGIMELLNLEDLVFNIEKLDLEEIQMKIDEIIFHNADIKKTLKNNVINMKKEADKNIIYARKYLWNNS